ncbi:PREDICTED: uncharacterized protein LOC107098794 [Cyprinodon variegatus]|uniref:Uncharacterized LOC107098794 n=1 Tax=Cyprinodon variegatus TaxID=28743 RepID=A0A3Q2D3J1_CYPVA|nr:PREDICTED: uncharacterized protein LOC107098794 [Cyprinodon variegatus]
MAEGSSNSDPEGLERQLESLSSRYSGDESETRSELFCADFCKVVEEYASQWRVPLPQLRILEIALRHFSRASAFFPTSCDHVHRTLGSLALSVFELLLFFDQKEFNEEPLKIFTATFQECHSVLAKYENVFLLQVGRLLQIGGLWTSPALQAILSESSLPQNEVDCYISSEPPAFLELRVRYLSSCGRDGQAAALAKCCVWHPAAGQLLFFLQFYLSWLIKTDQHERLQEEVADINGKDALHIICSLEGQEPDELLLALTTACLSQQLQRGDMFHLCELVLVWTNLHRRLNSSKQTLLEQCHQLMRSATNVKSIFPFIRAVLQEVGEDAVQFCVELCANALRSRLPCDVLTKTLIYKTIAGLLPSDLDVCRVCALLVFFLEPTVEAYKMVYLLYMHPDQEYHVDDSPIGNNIRFETLQVLKKDLYFDPEFWNLFALRTNCLKLMSEKVVSAALEEIMEDKWISKYCTRSSALRSVCQRRASAKKRHNKEDVFCKRDSNTGSKRLRVDTDKMRLNNHTLKRKGKHRSQALRESSSGPLRRSFWQLDRIHGSLTLRYDEHRRTTRFSERNLPKRKIKKPKWLLEDSGALENVPIKMKRNGLKQQKLLRSCVMKRSQSGPIKNNTKYKPPVNTHLNTKENNEYKNGFSLDSIKPTNSPQIILELSLPDNELMDTFSDDSCNRPRRFPQVLLYKPMVKYPETSPPVKTGHRKEVILRARDTTMFVQLLHCYARRQKGKGSGLNIHSSVSTITRSSAQVSPSKDSEPSERPVSDSKGTTPEKVKEKGSHGSEKLSKAQSTKEAHSSRAPQTETETDLQNTVREASPHSPSRVTELKTAKDYHQAQSGGEAFEDSAVEMKVTIASQASVLDKVSKSGEGIDQISKVARNRRTTDEILPVSMNNIESDNVRLSQSENVAVNNMEQGTGSMLSDHKNLMPSSGLLTSGDATEELRKTQKENVLHSNDTSPAKNIHLAASCIATIKHGARDKSPRTSAVDTVTKGAPEQFPDKDQERNKPLPGLSKSLRGKGKPKNAQKIQTTSSTNAREEDTSVVDIQVKKEDAKAHDARSETSENSDLMEMAPETEESKLEHYCTLCSKFFTGARVVEHAMFHFRRDECTFCKAVFKDDLLAMMHLSDHIEKMKRLKAGETGASLPKTKTTNAPHRHKGKEKPKESTVSPKTSKDISTSESRTLRSNKRQTSERSSHEKQKPKHIDSETSSHRVNGHIGKKNEFIKLKKDSKQESVRQQSPAERTRDGGNNVQRCKISESSTVQIKKELVKSSEDGKKRRESLQLQQESSKQIGGMQKKTDGAPEKMVSCPSQRCTWFADLLKNKVGLLYHALDKHYGDVKPLELAFRVADNKCSICMRVMWSFEHFQHHVERHRIIPRHPCPHRGCKARFKSGMEMRRHARKHSPLQAMCCRPGCSKLFICLWALNLHEREHYASKLAMSDSSSNGQGDEKALKTPHGKKTQRSEHASESTLRKGTKLSEQAKSVFTFPTGSSAQIQNKLRPRNKSTDSNVSEKETSLPPLTINLRLRQSLREAKATKQVPKSHKVISSSFLKHRNKVKTRIKLRNIRMSTRGPGRRKCPPRLSKTAAGQKMPPPDTLMLPRISTKAKAVKEKGEAAQDEGTTTEKTPNDSKSKTSKAKRITRNQISSKSHSTTSNKAGFSDLNRQKPTVDKTKLHKIQKHSVPSDFRKLKKNDIGKVKDNKQTMKTSQKQSSASAKAEESEPVKGKVVVEGSVDKKAENQDLGLINAISSVPDGSGKSTDMPPKPLRAKTERISKVSGARKDEKTPAANLKPMKKAGLLKKRVNQKVKGKHPGKNQTLENLATSKMGAQEQDKKDKTKGAEGILKGLKRLMNNTLDEKGKRKETPKNATQVSPLPSIPDVQSAGPSNVPEQSKERADKVEKPKKSKMAEKSETSRATKRRKETNKDGTRKATKKKCKLVAKQPANPLGEGELIPAEMGDPPKPPMSDLDSASRSETPDEKGWIHNIKLRPCEKTLAAYGKKPYLRLPPTAYLDEKFTTMPKRRKEMPLFQSSSGDVPPQLTCVKETLKRHRCTKCFSTFSSAAELQRHNQLQKCSNLFGFDSDDEGNS